MATTAPQPAQNAYNSVTFTNVEVKSGAVAGESHPQHVVQALPDHA